MDTIKSKQSLSFINNNKTTKGHNGFNNAITISNTLYDNSYSGELKLHTQYSCKNNFKATEYDSSIVEYSLRENVLLTNIDAIVDTP